MSLGYGSWSKQQIIAGVLGVLMPPLVSAANWTLSPSVTLAESYTDNVTLSSDNSPKESQWITQIIPGLSLTGQGRELDFSLAYHMQSLFYAGNSERNNINHQLDSRAKASLISRFLFLDASANVSQQVVNPDEKFSANNLAIVSNRRDVATVSLSPYIETRLSKNILAHIRATQDRVMYGEKSSLNSTSNKYEMRLSSASKGDWSWGLRLSSQDINYEEDVLNPNQTDEKNRDAVFNLGYKISPKIQLTALSGHEEYEYQHSAISNQPKDNYWQAGAIWKPNSRSTLTLGGGKRFFGRTWYLNVQQKGRRNTLQVGYNESLSSRRQLQVQQRLFYQYDETTGAPVTDPVSGSILLFPLDVLVPTNEVFIDRRANMRWSFSTRKTTTSIYASHSKREYQLSNTDETVTTAAFIWDLKLTKRNNIAFNANRQNTKTDVGDDSYSTVSLKLNRKLGRHVNSAFVLLHSRRNTDVTGDTNDYTENQLSANLDMKW